MPSSWREGREPASGRGAGCGRPRRAPPPRGGPGAGTAAAPADRAVSDLRAFREIFRKALRVAGSTGRFVTLGIAPKHPATGYGYIERGKPFRKGGRNGSL